MAKKQIIIPKDNNIIRLPLEEVMPDNYLPYAVEVAKDRALPDVRDGLKPVHRRILYGAYMLKAFPDKPYYKSARIVGDILGKYHPHGDTSVYDAMVILAQNFSTRQPLIDGHGNWGSIDGDGAAAMRYTEARLSQISMEMLRDIEKGVVEMVPNYSDSDIEPKVLPARYPNLLVNGTFGIAVGLATNIPPHNLNEVISGTLAYIENNDIKTEELMEFIKGPDLPTGGILMGKNSLRTAYETGEGKVALRAKTSIDKLENGRLAIIITEFPFRRNKAKILQTISEMTADKKHSKALESITDIRDESDREGVRAAIEFKKAADEVTVNKVLKYLFKKTDLQCNLSFNMVALANGKPETMGLKTIITHYVNHQKDVVTKRTQIELESCKKRFHIVEGFIKAIGILDDIIETIRGAKSKKDANAKLVDIYDFTTIQAEAILELMLYRLTGLEIKVFEKEYKELLKKIRALEKILGSEKELLKVITKELKEIQEKYGENRRTTIVEDEKEAKIDLNELIVVEDVVITLSNDGFIKRLPLKNYNRLNSDENDIEYRDGDYLKNLIRSNTRDNLILFTDKGNMYQIKVNNIFEAKWKEKGEKLDTLIKNLNLENENIISAISISEFMPNKVIKFITSNGLIKKTSLDKFITAYSKLMALKLKDKEKLISAVIMDSKEDEKFIKVKTLMGLEFIVEEPKLEFVDRIILGENLCPLNSKDEIILVEYVDSMEYKEFVCGINKKGNIKIYKNYSKSTEKYEKVKTNSLSYIVAFSDKGKVFKFPSYFLDNLTENHLDNLVDNFDDDENIIKVISLPKEEERIEGKFYVYFSTKQGFVKKMDVKELYGSFNNQIVYKFKNQSDKLLNININIGTCNILFITKKGFYILFSAQSVSQMGKNASGVTAISLREEDEAMFSTCLVDFVDNSILKEYNEVAITSEISKIILISKENVEKEISISDIKLQNRARRGNSIMVINMDDYIKEVLIQ